MSALFFLPGLVSLFLVLRGRIETAFLSIYLPALLFLPDGYSIRLPHLPTLSVAEITLIPIGIAALLRFIRSRTYALMDLLVALFILGLISSELFRERVFNDGVLLAVKYFISIFLAYVVGRKLIEPGLRLVTVRRIVLLILLLGPLGLIEWRLGINLYGIVGQKLFHVWTSMGVQQRSGRGRMGGAFTDAEIAGIAFGMTAALNAWLFYLYKNRLRTGLGALVTQLEKWHIPAILLFIYVLLTQSRGPLLGVVIAYPILQIPRFRNTKLASGIVALFIILGSLAAYQYYSRYANVSDPTAIADEQQGSAYYRMQMNQLYPPLADKGGWLGWGMLNRPVLPGMYSIDNAFLLVHLTQGKLGYFLFILIALESVRTSVFRARKLPSVQDRAFAFSMLGAMAVFWLSITTVYMGEQLPQYAFLLIGWNQSLTTSEPVDELSSNSAVRPKFAFQRVFK